jgi:hypothetical protein
MRMGVENSLRLKKQCIQNCFTDVLAYWEYMQTDVFIYDPNAFSLPPI